MRYRVKVLLSSGAVSIREIEASTEEEVAGLVDAVGAKVVSTRALRAEGRFNDGGRALDLVVFSRQLLTLLDAGQPVLEAIGVLAKNNRKEGQRAVLSSLQASLQEGNQLSAALSKHPAVFPALFTAMIAASETTGNVRDSLSRFIAYQLQADALRRRIVSAAIYPLILSIVGFAVVAFLLLYVAPKFSAVLDDVSVGKSDSGVMLRLWGGFVRENTLLAWGAFLGVMVGGVGILVRDSTRTRFLRLIEKAPGIGVHLRVLQLARIYRTVAMLLKGGIPLLTSLRMTRDSLPEAYRPALSLVAQDVSEGIPLSRAMTDRGLSTDVSDKLVVAGESSGTLTEMLDRVADFFDQESDEWLDTASRLLEPIMMVVIGLLIGVVVLMLYSPIFDLANAV